MIPFLVLLYILGHRGYSGNTSSCNSICILSFKLSYYEYTDQSKPYFSVRPSTWKAEVLLIKFCLHEYPKTQIDDFLSTGICFWVCSSHPVSICIKRVPLYSNGFQYHYKNLRFYTGNMNISFSEISNLSSIFKSK